MEIEKVIWTRPFVCFKPNAFGVFEVYLYYFKFSDFEITLERNFWICKFWIFEKTKIPKSENNFWILEKTKIPNSQSKCSFWGAKFKFKIFRQHFQQHKFHVRAVLFVMTFASG